jgi:hypothetical protein
MVGRALPLSDPLLIGIPELLDADLHFLRRIAAFTPLHHENSLVRSCALDSMELKRP